MNESPASSSPSEEILAQAAHWAAMLDGDDASAADMTACEEWCASNPVNRQTLERMRSFDARINDVGDVGRQAIGDVLKQSGARRRWLGGALVVLMTLASYSLLRSDLVLDRFPDHRIGTGQIETYRLADGSQVILDTGGEIRADMDHGRRLVRLITGRLMAEVSKDRRHPFVVQTTYGSATAIGTKFMVDTDDTRMAVTVVESHVRVCAEHADKPCVILGPGERAEVTASGIGYTGRADATAESLWTTGWLEADDQDVASVLKELSRYSDTPIRYDAEALRGIKVTGSFPLRNVPQALNGIARLTGLNVRNSESAIFIESFR